MNEHRFEIATDDTGQTFAPLAEGITNADPSNNEELDQTKYMSGGGFGSTDIIGAQLVITFTGHRFYGDEAQDYIFGKMLSIGGSRRTQFRWTEPDGGVIEGDCTIANIAGPSGDAGAKGEISFEMHFNGVPEYTPPEEDPPQEDPPPVEG